MLQKKMLFKSSCTAASTKATKGLNFHFNHWSPVSANFELRFMDKTQKISFSGTITPSLDPVLFFGGTLYYFHTSFT